METNQQNQDEIEIDLLELLRVLWSKIGYVILAALALGLLMVLVSKVFMKPQYESTTKMYVLSKQDSSSTVTSGDLQASSLLTKDYAELIQSRQVVETVIAQLNLDLTYEEFFEQNYCYYTERYAYPFDYSKRRRSVCSKPDGGCNPCSSIRSYSERYEHRSCKCGR